MVSTIFHGLDQFLTRNGGIEISWNKKGDSHRTGHFWCRPITFNNIIYIGLIYRFIMTFKTFCPLIGNKVLTVLSRNCIEEPINL